MTLSSVNQAVLTRLFTGGQRRFSSRGTPDRQRKPLIEGLFFAQILPQRLCAALFLLPHRAPGMMAGRRSEHG